MQVNIENLIDEARCYETVCSLRWADNIHCAHCESTDIIKRGKDEDPC